MLKHFFKLLVELSGNRRLSSILMRFTTSKWSKRIIPLFIKVYKVNKEEMELDVSDYISLHHLFTRKLKAGARKVNTGENVLISPVDGIIRDFGKINGASRFLIKHTEIDVVEMLGDKDKANKYMNGSYIIFYLSPHNYHRIHSPIKGKISSNWTLGGISYPVNNLGLKYGNRPLSTNYRLITEINGKDRNVAVVKVGALNVNSIHMTNDTDYLQFGDEIAYFSFGSTVILLIENKNFHFTNQITEEKVVKYGEKIGTFS